MTENPFKKAIESRQAEPDELASPMPIPEKKLGRPATGKRSDKAWIGRSYFIRRSTDLRTESELLDLKYQGIELDKSELVDSLLDAWVRWRNGEDLEGRLDAISPRRKDAKEKS